MNRPMLGPVTCKCGEVFTSRGAITNHVRWRSPGCRKGRSESRRLYEERYPERAAESRVSRQARWRVTSLGRTRSAEMEARRTPDQRRSRWAVKDALRSGRLLRRPCQECGYEPAQGHHHNGYSLGHELDVIWLCPKHHSAAHRRMATDAE